MTVVEVYESLRTVADAKGKGSQDLKIRTLVDLLGRSGPVEAKYIVRFVLGQLRLGVREMTLLDALAQAFGEGSKEARRKIEEAFNLSSDLGLVAVALVKHGLEGLASVHLSVGRPIRPMLAERSPTLADVLERMGGSAALEMKYDGLRVQAHIGADGSVRLFSRRLEEIGAQFPELLPALAAAVRHRPAIVEGECVPIDPDTDEIRPFQEISRRRGRKFDLERMQAEVPVSIFLFDVLLDGDSETSALPFPERRRRLVEMIRPGDRVHLADQLVVHSVEEAQAYFDRCIAEGGGGHGEIPRPGKLVPAGARGFWWIKYKREYTHGLADSIDAVVVGAFYGKGRRAGRYGALLMAVYDPDGDRFPTLCKVGSGFDDAMLEALPLRLKGFEVDGTDPRVQTSLTPDRWMTRALVLELRGAELTLSPTQPGGPQSRAQGVRARPAFPAFHGPVPRRQGARRCHHDPGSSWTLPDPGQTGLSRLSGGIRVRRCPGPPRERPTSASPE